MSHSLILLILAGLMVGMSQIFRKKITESGYDSRTYTTVIMLVNTVFSAPLLFYDFQVSHSPFIWALVVLSTTVFAFSTYFSFQAYKTTDVSIVAIIQKTSIIFIALIGIFFLRENYVLSSYIGLGLLLLSSFILSYEKNKSAIHEGIIFAFLMAFTGAIAAVLDKIILTDFSPYTYVFINNLLVGLIFAFDVRRFKEAKKVLHKHSLGIFFTSLFGVGSFLIVAIVLKTTDVSKTMPVYKSLGLIVPVLIGILVLGEKGKLPQKILGVILGAIGIFLLYATH